MITEKELKMMFVLSQERINSEHKEAILENLKNKELGEEYFEEYIKFHSLEDEFEKYSNKNKHKKFLHPLSGYATIALPHKIVVDETTIEKEAEKYLIDDWFIKIIEKSVRAEKYILDMQSKYGL